MLISIQVRRVRQALGEEVVREKEEEEDRWSRGGREWRERGRKGEWKRGEKGEREGGQGERNEVGKAKENIGTLTATLYRWLKEGVYYPY